MTYRDDLDAALARIESLKGELKRELASDSSADDQITELRRRNQELEAELERMQRDLDVMAEKVYGPQAAQQNLSRMRPLPAANRKMSSRLPGTPLDVLCPSCLEIGDRVQMVRQDPSIGGLVFAESKALIPVICPACATLGMLRVS